MPDRNEINKMELKERVIKIINARKLLYPNLTHYIEAHPSAITNFDWCKDEFIEVIENENINPYGYLIHFKNKR